MMMYNNNIHPEDDDKNMVNEPLEQYGQPLNFDKVWLMFKETDRQFKETDRQFKETDRQFKETRAQMQETDKMARETKKSIKETDQIVKRLSKIVSGLGINIGEVAEDYFTAALENLTELSGIKIEQIDSNMSRKKGGLEGEYDIVMSNHDEVIIVEVKHKLHPGDVDDFYERKIPVFKKLFPEYSGKKIIGALASLTVRQEVKKKAFEKGFLLLTQAGQKVRMLNPKGFKPFFY